jgi:hypothetical protein
MVTFNLCKGFSFTDILQEETKCMFVYQMSACSVDMFVYISIPNSEIKHNGVRDIQGVGESGC